MVVPRPTRALALGLLPLLLLTGLTLVVAAGLKAHCLTTDWTLGHQPKSCYNDIQTLWYQRDMGAHEAPYQGASCTRWTAPGTR